MRKMSSKLLVLLASLVLIFVAGCSKEDVMIDDSKLKEKEEENVEVVEKVEDEDVEVVEEDDEEVVEEDRADGSPDSGEALSEEKYIDAMTEVINIYSDIIFDINKHVSKALDDITLLDDDKWVREYENMFMPIAMLVEVMEASEEQGRVPEGYQDMHESIKDSLMLMDDAGEIIIEAVNNDDIENYKKGIEMISESIEKMDEVEI